MSDPNPLVSGAKELRERHVAVIGPVCQKEAAALNRRYIRNASKKPFVAIKMAMSADGKTATRTGDSKWISCAHSRECVRRMRGDFGAVMVGAGTILKDNPRLTARTRGVPDPYRIIVDGGLCISTTAKVLGRDDGKTIIATSEKAKKQKIRSLQSCSQPGMRPLILVCGKSDVDLRVLVTALGAMGIRKILVEGGSELNARMLEAGIVDRIYLFVAPLLIGGRNARGVIGGVGPACVAAALRLKPARTRRIGQDLLLEYDPSK
jgi:diaminohydroxyphosphoribosylaminopyrimidine deaminase/5-amino-6-(5-phosphoribosylamino)uracil reductase